MAARVLILADTHCGDMHGLTPPPWQLPRDSIDQRAKWRKSQVEHWNWFHRELSRDIKRNGPYDVVIANGDMIDGCADRRKGVDLITADRAEQCSMAEAALRVAVNPKTSLTIIRGTPYHTGDGEDWEDILAERLNAAKIGNHEWVGVENVVFDCKHKIAGSSVPHGRHTATSREALWSLIWSERGQSPKSNFIIRSHVHYYQYCGADGWMGFTTPALQALGGDYGTRSCSGTVDYGFLTFDVDGENAVMTPHIVRLKIAHPTVLQAV